jgi:RecA/RadA recombinase
LSLTRDIDRLPTQSAFDALLDLRKDEQVLIKSGLEQLDQILSGDNDSSRVGIDRGKVTEIWGPSGSGKTLLA